jgi:TRAP-type C4-dicarboxylate transport system permease small subunit
MVVTGIETARRAYVRGEVITGVVSWPTWLYYVFVPIGIGLLLLRVILHVVDLMMGGQGYVPSVSGEQPEPEASASANASGDGA